MSINCIIKQNLNKLGHIQSEEYNTFIQKQVAALHALT